MTGQESKATGLLTQEHGAQVAVAQTDLTLIGYRTGDTEGLKSLANSFGGLCGRLDALLDGDGGAHGVSPGGVFKADGLNALYDTVCIHTCGVADGFGILHILDAVLVEHGEDLIDSSFVSFKGNHSCTSIILPGGR